MKKIKNEFKNTLAEASLARSRAILFSLLKVFKQIFIPQSLDDFLYSGI